MQLNSLLNQYEGAYHVCVIFLLQAIDLVWIGLKDLSLHPSMPRFRPKEGLMLQMHRGNEETAAVLLGLNLVFRFSKDRQPLLAPAPYQEGVNTVLLV